MFAKILKSLRTEIGLTQNELAEKLFMSKNTICEYEKGRAEPSIETLKKIADVFGCSIDYLVGRENDFAISQAVGLSGNEKTLLSAYRSLPENAKKTLLNSAITFKELSQNDANLKPC